MIVGAWLGPEVEWSVAGRRFVEVGGKRIEVESHEELLARLETEKPPEGGSLSTVPVGMSNASGLPQRRIPR